MMTLIDQSRAPPPWGVLATLAWLVISFAISALVAVAGFVLILGDHGRSLETYDGVLVAVGALTSVPVQIAVLAWAARLRGWVPRDYLALNMPKRGEIILAVICVVAINLAFNGLLFVAGRDVVAPFQVAAYKTAQSSGWLLWLFIAIVVVAPVGEEIVFRGFLYRGLVQPGWELYAIVAIALVWSLLHIQYDWLGMVQIFGLGVLLGWFRWASGSTTLAVLMHALINLEAMIETAIKVEGLP
jgi:membrane protease YdiL (CAAX protease family)